MDDANSLARQFSTSARKLRPVGSLIVEQSPLTHKTYILRARELKLQKHLLKCLEESSDPETVLAKACFESGVTVEWAKQYFNSRRYKNWLSDRIEEIELNAGLTPAYIAQKHKDNIEGKIVLTTSKLSSLSELAERIWPKVQKIEHKVEKEGAASMDDLMAVQKEVEELEQKLMAAHQPKEAA